MIEVTCKLDGEQIESETVAEIVITVKNYGSTDMGWVQIDTPNCKFRCDGNDLLLAVANALRST